MSATVAPAVKRGAIIGTAPSWKSAPWDDLSVDLFGLNDAYVLGFKRISGWFDLHPFGQMVFHSTERPLREIPLGAYVRPEGHLEWLRSRPFPVSLAEAPADWPTATTFPRAALEAKYGRYFASTPAWMLAWMIEAGYTEIQIWGIHLATDWEYLEQRPNLEFLMGLAFGRGIKLVIPERSPLLKSPSLYAYEPKHDLPVQAQQQRIAAIKARGARLQQRMAACRWYDRRAMADLTAQARVAELELTDARMTLQRLQLVLAGR